MTHWAMLLKGITLQLVVFEIFPFVSYECPGYNCQSHFQNNLPAIFVSSHRPLFVWIIIISWQVIKVSSPNRNHQDILYWLTKSCLIHIHPIRYIQSAYKLIFGAILWDKSIGASCFISSCQKVLSHSQRPVCNCLGVKPPLCSS